MPTKTSKMMHTTAQHKDVKHALVFKLDKRFSAGRSLLDNDKGRGWKPRIDSNVITSIRDVRRLTVSTLATMADVSVGNCLEHPEHLHISKVHALWVLHLLRVSVERSVSDSKLILKH